MTKVDFSIYLQFCYAKRTFKNCEIQYANEFYPMSHISSKPLDIIFQQSKLFHMYRIQFLYFKIAKKSLHFIMISKRNIEKYNFPVEK